MYAEFGGQENVVLSSVIKAPLDAPTPVTRDVVIYTI
jgi:hypothetical protein